MNTTLKGNLFEEKAYEIIMSALNAGQLGLLPNKSIPFRKKGYYSIDRKAEIIFDLSIEVWAEGAERYSWLCLIECKDYTNRKVEPGDLVKFVGDIDSVAGKNVKGIFISTAKLQKAAFNYAKSKGLMVIHVDAENQTNIVLHNVKRTNQFLTDAPVNDFNNKIDRLAEISNYYNESEQEYNNWEKTIFDFLTILLNNNAQGKQPDFRVEGLQHLSKGIIEKSTIDIINEFNPTIINRHAPFPMNEFILYIKQHYGVDVITNERIPVIKGKKLNGYYDREKETIHIDSSLVDTSKFNFVLAHEIGHYFLHSKLRMDQLTYDTQNDSEYKKTLGKYALVNEKHWIEWQANQFAAALLLSHNTLLFHVLNYQNCNDIHRNRGKIYLDYQLENKIAYQNIMLLFTEKFGVSLSVLEYRMSDLGILIHGKGASYAKMHTSSHERQSRSIGEIIQTMLEDNLFYHQ